MVHNIKIEQIKEYPLCTRVQVDEKYVRCSDYTISQEVGERPVVELKVCAVPNVEGEAIVHVSNKEEIARLMDAEEFKEFCEIWNEVHGHEK